MIGQPVNTSIGLSRLNSDNVSFNCFIDGGTVHSVQVTWYGPGAGTTSFHPQSPVPIQTDPDTGRVRSTLLLSDSAGDYWCETSYLNAPDCTAMSQSNTATLFIVTAPALLSEPTPMQLNVTMGTTLSYDCSFNASDTNSRLTFEPELANFSVFWTGPLGIIENGVSYEVLLSLSDEIVNITLIIREVDSSLGGEYTCTAENIDGSINSTVLLYVDPIIDPTNYTAAQNDSVTITCTVQDQPETFVSWQKEINGTFETLNSQITSNGRILNTTSRNLTFERVLFGDEGVYRCVADTVEFGALSSNHVLLTGVYVCMCGIIPW